MVYIFREKTYEVTVKMSVTVNINLKINQLPKRFDDVTVLPRLLSGDHQYELAVQHMLYLNMWLLPYIMQNPKKELQIYNKKRTHNKKAPVSAFKNNSFLL